MSLRRQPSAAGAGATPLPPTRAPLPLPLSASAQFRRIAAVLLLVLGIHGAGLFLFKEGYLLTRLELNSTATCPTVPPWSADFVPPAAAASAGGATSKACWPHARFHRTLLIMIDALRFDFIAYNESIPPTATPYYINKVPVISRMLKTRPAHSLLYRGLADPPTTTLQRLIALMTGALPTLVDAGSNFGSSAIREDNLVGHLQRAGRRVVSMGDDTWDRLFPTSLNETYPYPSFDVWDLHSVDEGVISHLFPALEKRRRSAAAAATGAAGTRTSTGNDSDSDWGPAR
ncbi:hypothetical protein BC831DRAFT_548500 [Entophlyctis helioformis]|nr:hypothetical protein BC831DRAFT_548500 [Entophlyctis helioformis]